MEDSKVFQQWCEEHGIKVFGIEIGEGLYGRGVLARDNIAKGKAHSEAWELLKHPPMPFGQQLYYPGARQRLRYLRLIRTTLLNGSRGSFLFDV